MSLRAANVFMFIVAPIVGCAAPAATDTSAVDASDTSIAESSVGTVPVGGDCRTAACAPGLSCVRFMTTGGQISMCYDATRDRCGVQHCVCASPFVCYTFPFMSGATEGYCLDTEEATRACSLEPGNQGGLNCFGGQPQPYAGCP